MDGEKIQKIALAPGQRLDGGRYSVQRVLGVGGFGITYAALNLDGKPVAIKEYFRASLCERQGTRMVYSEPVADQVLSGMRAFVNEGKRLSSLGHGHPNIVAIERMFYQNDTVYIVMEMVQGMTLEALVRNGQPLSADQARSIILPIVEAVCWLHRQRITHLDIKPGNIIISDTPQGVRPVLIDFGLSKHYDAGGHATTQTTLSGCTPGYAPPEQYSGGTEQYSPQSDVYALAATYYFALTGQDPAAPANRAAMQQAMAHKGVPEGIAHAILHAVAIDPGERPEDACAFMRELVQGSAPSPARGKLGRSMRRRLYAGLMAVALLGALAATGVWLLVDWDKPEAPTSGPGYGLTGQDVYAALPVPGAMLNLDALPVESRVGETFTVEIGVKTATPVANADSLAHLIQPTLSLSKPLSVDTHSRRSGDDWLTICIFQFQAEDPGVELVPEQSLTIDGHKLTTDEHRLQILQ